MRSQITRVNYPANFAGRNQKMCYVEFGDEEAMKAGLTKNGEVSLSTMRLCALLSTLQKLNDAPAELKQATDKESRGSDGGRGGFAGRGGRGRGSFAARGFASAGLMRGGGPPRANGDAPSSES